VSKKPEYPKMESRKLVFIHQIPITKTKRFWDGLREGKLYTTKCKKCGKIFYPPQTDCPECLDSEFEWITLPTIGTIKTFVVSYLKPQGFEHFKEPYIIAIVEVLEGVRIMGLIETDDYKDIRIGMKVDIIPTTDEEGYPSIIFKPRK
jgi:hypothetical protein